MKLKNVRGIWLPDHEAHLLDFATQDNWSYQLGKLQHAMQYVKKRELALDIGAHCGLWAKTLVQLFDHVEAFEPVREHRECFTLNVRSGNYTLHEVALGASESMGTMHVTQGSSGNSYVEPGADIRVRKLDSYKLAPDFIKIDTEGFELYVCQGGEQTIKTHKPVLIVEQKPSGHQSSATKYGITDTAAIDLLTSWGYQVREVLAGDYILTCN